ncbi:MAG: histidine kinase [Rhodanobacteraceae bacterium]|nr:histidine kinase [Rhodanobacteraceae bacterium]
MRKIKLPLWLNLLLLASAYSLFYAESYMNWSAAAGKPMRYTEALFYSFSGWITWVPFSLLLIWLVELRPLRTDTFLRSMPLLVSGVFVVIFAKAAYMYLTNGYFEWYDQPPAFSRVLVDSIRANFLYCWLVVGVAHAILYARHSRQREAQLIDMEAKLTAARLDALTAQLNPHFLFNTLNSIAELVHHDADGADRMLVGLSALLRCSLNSSAEQEFSLREEMEVLNHYLDIQKVRLGRRLRVSCSIEPESLNARVPVLILQPIVENAIVHSISRRAEGGSIHIQAQRDSQRLILLIENDGEASGEPTSGNGVGMRNTQSRLQCLYGNDYSFELTRTECGGARVRLELPYNTTPVPATASSALATKSLPARSRA